MNVFEENYYDEYDFYNIMPIENLFTRSGGKGRTKTEIQTRSKKVTNSWTVYAKLERESRNRSRKHHARSNSITSRNNDA
ncbi:unnamed protein product [Clavelina lepadiformis]|uniref:Uncharacterized protein n=1 Tax=Clavelina lepadiformis TaxID=159417 RepID=A0ABP0GL72_CLALP